MQRRDANPSKQGPQLHTDANKLLQRQTRGETRRREDSWRQKDWLTHSCPSSGCVEESSFAEGCRTGWCFPPRTPSCGLFVAWEELVELQHKATDYWCKTLTYIIISSSIWELVTPPVDSEAAVSQRVLLCFSFLEITPQIHTVYNIYSFIVVATLLIKGNGG